MTNRKADIECFYELMARLNERVGGPHLIKDFASVVPPTAKGVYFIFESGEVRSGQSNQPRVVRVGTHGLTARSRSTIWTRLFEHLMANGRSVFRYDINRALRQRGGYDDGRIGHNHSARITRYIGRMPFLWVDVDGDEGHRKRKKIEGNAIALLSNSNKRQGEAPDKPSKDWLGIHSGKDKIIQSGLWNVQHTKNCYSSSLFEVLSDCIDQTASFEQYWDTTTCLDRPSSDATEAS